MSPGGPAFEPVVLPTAVIPEHELLRPIASGAYGQVWLARTALGAYRAIKIVHRSNFDHERPFEREFAGIKAFEPISRSHEGLVDLLQVGRDDAAGYFYYVMELADPVEAPKSEARNPKDPEPANDVIRNLDFDSGHLELYVPRTLASELKCRGRLPLEDCIQLGMSLAEALAHLHSQGLVHRDIKPLNIIFVGGTPKLADVGLVAEVGEARSFVGTEGFIPPEGPGTAQADIYSLGIVLYVMSTGKSHQDFPEPLSDLAAQPDHARWLEFNEILHKACQAEVSERYQSADEMLEELALLQRGQSVKRKRAAHRRWAVGRKLGIGALGLALLVPVLSWLRAKNGHTPNAKAAKFYELGRWYYSQLTPEAHAKALEFLKQAVKVDPNFVQPYAEWVALYTWNSVPESSTEAERLQKTREIAERAMAIDPNSAEAHTALSWCKFLERNWGGAEHEIVQAIRLNPNLPIPHDIYCFYLSMLGRTEEARREGQCAEKLESPDSQRVTAIIAAWPYMAERRFNEAIAQLQRVIELDRNFAGGHGYLGDCYEAQSNYVAAIEEYKSCDLYSGLDTTKVEATYAALRQAFDTAGEEGYWRKRIALIQEQEALPENERLLSDSLGASFLAGCYARLGEKEKALDKLEEHFDEPQVWHQIKFLPAYDSLHNEPRFKALVRRAGLKE